MTGLRWDAGKGSYNAHSKQCDTSSSPATTFRLCGKLLLMLESIISLVTVIAIAARAINILSGYDAFGTLVESGDILEFSAGSFRIRTNRGWPADSVLDSNITILTMQNLVPRALMLPIRICV